MGTLTYCVRCDAEMERIGFNCQECESTYCEQCVGKAKDYGEGAKEFRCPVCSSPLFFNLPLPARVVETLQQGPAVGHVDRKMGAVREQFRSNKRASRPPGVKPGARSKGD